MIYVSTITVSANTSEANATKTTLQVTKGLVWKIEIEFPAGCCGLVRAQIFDGSYQIFPASINESIRGDGVIVSFDDLYIKDAAPFDFIIKTWNTDELWDHTIQVRVGFASQKAFMARYMPGLAWEEFENIVAGLVATQEVEKQARVEELIKEMQGG